MFLLHTQKKTHTHTQQGSRRRHRGVVGGEEHRHKMTRHTHTQQTDAHIHSSVYPQVRNEILQAKDGPALYSPSLSLCAYVCVCVKRD